MPYVQSTMVGQIRTTCSIPLGTQTKYAGSLHFPPFSIANRELPISRLASTAPFPCGLGRTYSICTYDLPLESRLGTSLSASRTNAGLCTPPTVYKRYHHSPLVHIPASFTRLTQKPSDEKPCPAANQMREQHPANLALLLIHSPTPIFSTSCL